MAGAPRDLARAARATIVALAGVLGACSAWNVSRMFEPADPEGTVRDFVVEPGEPLAQVGERLAGTGLLPEPWPFGGQLLVLYARLRNEDREIKSGEYQLSSAMSPSEILAKLVAGEVKTYAVTLPEGLRLDEIAARLEETGIVAHGPFLAAARDAAVARELGIEADSLEGYLYPETYRFPRNANELDVLRDMVSEFQRRWEELAAPAAARGLTRHQVMTLASIVEKETGAPQERPLIAAVFRNRLARRMRLQSDPTVIYGIVRTRGTFDGNLRRADLEQDDPYNTYTRGGLPPGPIASPGEDSIRAVLAPALVPYLYFVSRNDGTHEFSASLEEHQRAVERFQRARPGA